MITPKAFILGIAISSTVLLAGCTSANTVNDPGVPSRSASVGVPSTTASGSSAPTATAGPTDTGSAQGGDISVQPSWW